MNYEEAKKSLKKKFPFRELNVELTNICNLRCPLCFTGRGEAEEPRGKMDYEKFVLFIDNCSSLFDKVSFIGSGDPSLHPQFARFIRYVVKEKGLTAQCSTNGHIMDEPETLVHSGLYKIFIDIDGINQAQHEIYRIGANLDRVLKNIGKLIEAKRRLYSYYPMIYVDTLVSKHNEQDYERFIKLAEELGVNGIRFRSIIDPIHGTGDWEPTLLEYQHVKRSSPFKCYFQEAVTGTLTWNGDLRLCCLSPADEKPVTKLNVFEEDNLLEKLDSDKFHKLTMKAGHFPFCKECFFTKYEVFGREIDFNLPFNRSFLYWWGKYGKHPIRLAKRILRCAT